MYWRRVASCYCLGVVVAATAMYVLSRATSDPAVASPRLILVSDRNDAYWNRIVSGARDAAKESGVDLQLESLGAPEAPDQTALLASSALTGYDGVVISPADPESQRESLNELATRTKLVTIGKDSDALMRMCHVGYSAESTGRRVARFVLENAAAKGRIALVSTTAIDSQRFAEIQERQTGFKEQWRELGGDTTHTLAEIGIVGTEGQGATYTLNKMLGDQEWSYIVALDETAAAAALRVAANPARPTPFAVFAFDPTSTVLDAIDAGRSVYAHYDDPYYSGYEAVRRLAAYCRTTKTALPAAGHGEVCLFGEVIQRENLAQIRQRSPIVTMVAGRSASGERSREVGDKASADRVAQRVSNHAESFARTQASGN